MKEFLDGLESWAVIYIQEQFEDSCARMEMVKDGRSCGCWNCTIESVSNLNSYVRLIFTEESLDERLLFQVDKHGKIIVPKWYGMYTDAMDKEANDRK